MKYVSLFAGVGGFDYALNKLGHECVYANDFDKYCKIIYDKNFCKICNGNRETTQGNGKSKTFEQGVETKGQSIRPKWSCPYNNGAGTTGQIPHLDTTSITEVTASSIPDHDLLVGGFPCQSFSIAGKRGGFDDTRGTLFFDIARIAKEKRTKYLLLENVKGLLSHDQGRTFKTILSTLTELGYDLQTMVLNSKNFGVPQNRERVFIVGHLRGLSRPEVFPIGEDANPLITKGGEQSSDAVVSRTLTATDAKMHLDGNYISSEAPVAPTIRATQHKSGDNQTLVANYIQNPKMMNYKKDYQNSVAITATAYKEPPVVNGIRRLTTIECERLQGFPDNWTEGVSDTQRYKMCGNAVTTNVVYEVAKRMFL